VDVRGLIKDVGRIQASLQKLPDNSLVTKSGCKIYIPARFSERQLASISVETHIVGIYAMVIEDKYYAVSLINAMIRIDPVVTNKVSINGDEYYEFVFNPGSVVIPSLSLVKTNTLVYRVYDEIINKGRVPWYLKYPELAKLFESAKKHAGANIGGNHEVIELLVSMIARDPEDRTKYYRSTVQSLDDLVTRPPVFIPLKSVTFSATNTTNKLAGSYMQDGIVSALVSPAERTERIESLLRL
jgi:hypothetical protein